MKQYNLSINSVDGDTIYGCISSDKRVLGFFLQEFDHEGSFIAMVIKEDDKYTNIDSVYDIYKELEVE